MLPLSDEGGSIFYVAGKTLLKSGFEAGGVDGVDYGSVVDRAIDGGEAGVKINFNGVNARYCCDGFLYCILAVGTVHPGDDVFLCHICMSICFWIVKSANK